MTSTRGHNIMSPDVDKPHFYDASQKIMGGSGEHEVVFSFFLPILRRVKILLALFSNLHLPTTTELPPVLYLLLMYLMSEIWKDRFLSSTQTPHSTGIAS